MKGIFERKNDGIISDHSLHHRYSSVILLTLILKVLHKNQLSVADVMGDSKVTIDAKIGFVESFAIMGDCQEGQKARKEIEAKRDAAGKEIQDESKKYEKVKNDYVAKSSTMSDAARDQRRKTVDEDGK